MEKHLGLRIDEELHYKIKYIAKGEGRSITGQIIYWLRQCVADYETQNGNINQKSDGNQ